MVDDMWINKAVSKTGSLPTNTVFALKDLFPGVEWNKLSKGDKLDFGRQFKNLVNQELIPYVVYIGKGQNNSANYKKVIE